jgi:dTDP-4-dehydrorhamnose reductase
MVNYPHAKIDVQFDEWGCPTYTFDLANAIYQLCSDSNTTEKPPFGIYHLVNEGATTKANFVSKIMEFAKSKTEVVPVPVKALLRVAKRPNFAVLSNTKRPKLRFWQEALQECMISMGCYHREMP